MKKIFVIENDIDTLDLVGFVFEDKEYEVIKSQSSVSIDRIIEENPNLILLDYYLDGGYGKPICLEIKNNPHTKHIPVIIFSAMWGLEQAAKDSCADGFIAKPFDIDDLAKLVEDLIL